MTTTKLESIIDEIQNPYEVEALKKNDAISYFCIGDDELDKFINEFNKEFNEYTDLDDYYYFIDSDFNHLFVKFIGYLFYTKEEFKN